MLQILQITDQKTHQLGFSRALSHNSTTPPTQVPSLFIVPSLSLPDTCYFAKKDQSHPLLTLPISTYTHIGMWTQLQSLHMSSLLVRASSVESPAPIPSGHSPVYTQHSVVSSPGEEWMEVLWPQCPFIPVLCSALRCETVPGHEKTSFHPRGSCDRWWLAVSFMWLRTSMTTKEYGCSEMKAGRENLLVLPHLFFLKGAFLEDSCLSFLEPSCLHP